MIRIVVLVMLAFAAGIDDLGVKNFALILAGVSIYISLYINGRG